MVFLCPKLCGNIHPHHPLIGGRYLHENSVIVLPRPCRSRAVLWRILMGPHASPILKRRGQVQIACPLWKYHIMGCPVLG